MADGGHGRAWIGVLLALALPLAGACAAPLAPADSVFHLLARLADPALAGRDTGSPGDEQAVALLETVLDGPGLTALDGFSSHRQLFPVHLDSRLAAASLAWNDRALPASAWNGLTASAPGEVAAPPLFCGYGVVDPASGWVEYTPAEAAGRVLLMVRQVPAGLGSSPGWRDACGLARRVRDARAAGAAGVLFVDSPFDAGAARTRAEGPDAALGDLGLPVGALAAEWADTLLAGTGGALRERLSRLARARQPQPPVPLTGTLRMAIAVERSTSTTCNLGVAIPGRGAAARRWILLGAHHDHLGHGQIPGGPVHPGADDNASGCAMALALARDLAAELAGMDGERRSLAVVWFGGEERGRLGSRHLAESRLAWLDSLDLMVNLDMVGRLRDKTLLVLGGDGQAGLTALLEASAAGEDLRVKATGQSPGGDHESFAALGVPSLMIFTGAHEDYHKPTDTVERIVRDGLEPTRRALSSWLAQVLDPRVPIAAGGVVEVAANESGPVRVAIGITPGYESREGGMPVQDVKAGSAAQRAGLRAGDVLLSLGRFPVANIHDYTFALRHYAAGDELPVAYLRDGRRLQATVRLEERARP